MVMENFKEGVQPETDTHIIVRNTGYNGYEFATAQHGLFNLGSKQAVEDFMKRHKFTYNIVNKKSRLVKL